MTPTPDHLQSRLDRELDEGESINWSAQPNFQYLKRDILRQARTLIFLFYFFTVIFISFAAIFYFKPSEDESPITFVIFSAVSLFSAIFIRWMIIYHTKYVSNSTIYAITNKRAIIITVNKDKSITERDYRADELIHLARTEFPDGSGTLTLESARGAATTNQVAYRHQLRALDNVIEIERLLRTQFGDA
ncbi:MAG: hypothetical protein JJ974_03570 [Phycisphaerales bacterium]|nr:hypothetical protein [Phycisphaerales bacterium]